MSKGFNSESSLQLENLPPFLAEFYEKSKRIRCGSFKFRKREEGSRLEDKTKQSLRTHLPWCVLFRLVVLWAFGFWSALGRQGCASELGNALVLPLRSFILKETLSDSL